MLVMYHDAIDKKLDTIVAKRGSSKFKIAEMATEDLGGHGGNTVEQVNNDCRSCKSEEGIQF